MPRWPWKRQSAEQMIADGRASGPADERAADEAVIEQLRKAGSDLTQPTEVIHFVYLPDEEAARAFVREVEDRGFATTALEPDRDAPVWSVQATHELVVSIESITEARERLTGAAERHGGFYDGWEAAVVR